MVQINRDIENGGAVCFTVTSSAAKGSFTRDRPGSDLMTNEQD